MDSQGRGDAEEASRERNQLVWLYVPPPPTTSRRRSRGVLVLPARITPGVFRLREKFKVFDSVVGPVAVFVVYVMLAGYSAVVMLPDIPMQVRPPTAGATIVPNRSLCVLSAIKQNKRQRLATVTERPLPQVKHLIYGLTANAECPRDGGEAVPRRIEIVHGLGFCVLPVSWHVVLQ